MMTMIASIMINSSTILAGILLVLGLWLAYKVTPNKDRE
jgi:uncharacterized BrkB/YihY/UPF0761 family membrane protein